MDVEEEKQPDTRFFFVKYHMQSEDLSGFSLFMVEELRLPFYLLSPSFPQCKGEYLKLSLTLFRINTSFSPITSTNVGISPQNLLTFSFNPFATLV